MNRPGLRAEERAQLSQRLGEASFLSEQLALLLRSLDPKAMGKDRLEREPENGAGPSKVFADEFPRIAYHLRRTRDRLFPGLFSDPSWDILLDLYHWQRRGESTSSSSCCSAAAVPPTTALRHISQLVDHGFVKRKKDKTDGRLVLLELTTKGVQAIDHWLRLAEISIAQLGSNPKY